MTGRVILFGATGFTGRLVAESMVRAGLAPVLGGRSPDALVALVGDLAPVAPFDAPPTWRRADAADPASVRALVDRPDDVIVTTVGPFTRLGRPAVEAAIAQGCGYVDSTGEPDFIRRVFESDGPRAAASGASLLTAFGYDYVPGNLAGALALRDARTAGHAPTRVDVGYFVRGGMALSSGTRASAATVIGAQGFAFRSGRLSTHPGSVATFEVDGTARDGMPVGGSEHFALPRQEPRLMDVGVYLGWAGRLTRVAHRAGGLMSAASRVPGVGGLLASGLRRASGSQTGEGPSPQDREGTESIAVARTLDGVGRQLTRVQVRGPSPYDLTADLLAWAAAMLVTGRATGPGALGPADAFGLDELERGCADLGLRRVD